MNSKKKIIKFSFGFRFFFDAFFIQLLLDMNSTRIKFRSKVSYSNLILCPSRWGSPKTFTILLYVYTSIMKLVTFYFIRTYHAWYVCVQASNRFNCCCLVTVCQSDNQLRTKIITHYHRINLTTTIFLPNTQRPNLGVL